jgi:hypothetical protein
MKFPAPWGEFRLLRPGSLTSPVSYYGHGQNGLVCSLDMFFGLPYTAH